MIQYLSQKVEEMIVEEMIVEEMIVEEMIVEEEIERRFNISVKRSIR
jgi:hypothetical protein